MIGFFIFSLEPLKQTPKRNALRQSNVLFYPRAAFTKCRGRGNASRLCSVPELRLLYPSRGLGVNTRQVLSICHAGDKGQQDKKVWIISTENREETLHWVGGSPCRLLLGSRKSLESLKWRAKMRLSAFSGCWCITVMASWKVCCLLCLGTTTPWSVS